MLEKQRNVSSLQMQFTTASSESRSIYAEKLTLAQKERDSVAMALATAEEALITINHHLRKQKKKEDKVSTPADSA